ncbi:unnamed protein product [Prunus armeniaca]
MSIYARSSCLTISAKEIMYGTMMCWKSADSGKAMLVMVYLFPSPNATRMTFARDWTLGRTWLRLAEL